MLHLMLLNECLLHFLCYHDGVMMSFDSSCNFHHCCDDCWLSVYYNQWYKTDINFSKGW